MTSGKLVATVQGSAAQPYELRETADPAVLWCSCPAWRNNKERPKTCKHIKAHVSGTSTAVRETSTGTVLAEVSDRYTPVSESVVRAFHGKPMRLETVDTADAVALFESDDWGVEQKVDGTRVVIQVDGDDVRFYASNGEPLKHATSMLHVKRLKAALPAGEYSLDGELLWTGDYWAFDMPGHNGTFAQRRAALEEFFATTDVSDPVRLLPQARTLEEKVGLFKQVYAQGGEGVVLKHLGKSYELDRRVNHQLKLKFTKTVDCVISARNVRGKENAELELYDTDGQPVAIGGCSMIGKPAAQIGDVVEVKYLYSTEDGRIYQPTLLRIRTDKRKHECTTDQLTPVNKEVLEAL